MLKKRYKIASNEIRPSIAKGNGVIDMYFLKVQVRVIEYSFPN